MTRTDVLHCSCVGVSPTSAGNSKPRLPLLFQVLHEIVNPEKYRGAPMTSLPGFTSLIKGFRRGELTVLTGEE